MITSNRKHLIVCTGRSGSSLLSSIIADSGGEFAMLGRDSWNRRSGWYEHPQLVKAYVWFQFAQKLRGWPPPYRRVRRIFKQLMRRKLKHLMARIQFAKSPTLIWLVDPIHALGFETSVIVSYRAPQGFLASKFKRTRWSLPEITDHYYETYTTALLQLSVYGGCAISYEELLDLDETDWATALSCLTGLDQQQLLENRERRVKAKRMHSRIPVFDNRVDLVHAELEKLKGQVIVP